MTLTKLTAERIQEIRLENKIDELAYRHHFKLANPDRAIAMREQAELRAMLRPLAMAELGMVGARNAA